VWWQDDVAFHRVLAAPGHPAPRDLLHPAGEEPMVFGLTATAVEQQPGAPAVDCRGPEAVWPWSPH
jgi:hypothetical protein